MLQISDKDTNLKSQNWDTQFNSETKLLIISQYNTLYYPPKAHQ